MVIKDIRIQNFKTFDSVGVQVAFGNITALVGENSAGKSNVLEALDLFFNYSKANVTKDSFHHHDTSLTISIEVSFSNLTEAEKTKFRPHLAEDNETLVISQRIKNLKQMPDDLEQEAETSESAADDDELNIVESKHGIKWTAAPEFEWLNCLEKAPTKKALKEWWKADLKIGEFDFKSLFATKTEPTPEDFQTQVIKFWLERHSEIPRVKISGDDKVLGWKNKLKGNLPKYFLVPALRNLEDDLKAAKTSPFSQIITYLTNEINRDMKLQLQNETKDFIDNLIAKMDQTENGTSKISQINRQLNTNIGIDLDCKLQVQFNAPSIEDLIIPKLYADDGFNSEITQKGHGVQRMALFSLLRTYHHMKDSTAGLSRIIMGIEEPEIYLHPPVKRATYNLLRNLADSGLQIAYTTHDSYFVKVEHFDEIRLFRRTKYQDQKHRTNIFSLAPSSLIEFYKREYKLQLSEQSLRDRFQHICDESKNEGFFARKVILIEGDTEKYALPIYFKAKDLDIDNEKISIISAGSVDSITYLLLIFSEFGIPCYAIFDGDKPDFELKEIPENKKDEIQSKSRRNKELMSLLGEKISTPDLFFPETKITEKFAVWEKDFESTFHRTLDIYDTVKSEAKKLYGNDSKPLTAKYIAKKITTSHAEQINPYIERMISEIKGLNVTSSIISEAN